MAYIKKVTKKLHAQSYYKGLTMEKLEQALNRLLQNNSNGKLNKNSLKNPKE